jgi:dTDP-4-amino-4,6-dideoxygalactose transaminase
VTEKTRAIIAAHLYGQPAMMDAIRQVALQFGLRVIEDAAQAHGAKCNHQPVGALADAGAFSFYPAKNLGAFGDAGGIVTNDRQLADRVRRLRNYGASGKYDHDIKGFNSRLDPLQAAFLRVRLRHIDEWNERRKEAAQAYLRGLDGVARCTLPAVPAWAEPCWHLFVIGHPRRDLLGRFLESRGIETLVHYPVPPHLARAYADSGWRRGDFPITEHLAGTVLSLPMGPHLKRPHMERVVQAIIDYEALSE